MYLKNQNQLNNKLHDKNNHLYLEYKIKKSISVKFNIKNRRKLKRARDE